MPKIITNKERIDRLTKELAKLKAEKDIEISGLKRERRELRSKIAYLDKKLSCSISKDSPEIKKLEEENQLLRSNCNDLIKAKGEGVVKQLIENREDSPTKKDKDNLWRFRHGYTTDVDGNPFFDKETLLIRICPKTGRLLERKMSELIYSVMSFCPLYHKSLRELEDIKKRYPEHVKFLERTEYRTAMELFPIYMSFII